MTDADFLAALSPVATELLDRHLAGTKEWFPHEMVPWSRGRDFAEGEPFDPEEAQLAEGVRSALLLNLLTEDNLPYYFRQIDNAFGDDDPWHTWNRRWTAEENRHSIVIRDYLTVTRSIDLRELERARMSQMSTGIVPDPAGIGDGIVYVALQELATRISHRNTGKLLDDPVGTAIMSRVAADENFHHLFYRDLTTAAIEYFPSEMVASIERQVKTFEMPGTGVPNFRMHARQIANVGVYDFASHYEQVLVPMVCKHWRIDQLEGLTADGERARDRLFHLLTRIEHAADRTKRRQAASGGCE